ncbi:hypothetical protein FGIG_01171 [Fasciola gigantica]|uniref:Uncharacterized protein n=1 Tax=Fasciola gigantica TaxID=46835 RepID=A0A504YEG7_FASGI|nr:hypothetical protein FGIG_01171 [Fasciola gigantica]
MTACLFNFNRDRVFATCFRILIIPVVIADLFTNQPREEYFPTSCGKKCDNLIILDFGACGSVVRLTPELRAKKTLSIRIASLDKKEVGLQNHKTFAIILYTEKAYIQWLVLFPELQMIWNWDYRRGHHEAFEMVKYEKNICKRHHIIAITPAKDIELRPQEKSA